MTQSKTNYLQSKLWSAPNLLNFWINLLTRTSICLMLLVLLQILFLKNTPIDHFEALTMGNQNWECVIEQTIKTTEFWLTNYHDIGWMIYWIVQVPVTNFIYNVTLNSSRQVGTLSNDLLFWLPIWQTLHTCSLERTSMCYLIHHSSWDLRLLSIKCFCLFLFLLQI